MRVLLALSAVAAALAGQTTPWPQWGGPHRNFHTAAATLANAWPAEGPRKVWERLLGGGHSQVAVLDSVLYTMYRDGADEIVLAADAETGKTIWEYRYAAAFRSEAADHGHGPYATPLVTDGRVFAVGATGNLHCLEARTGKVLWSQGLWSGHRGNRLPYGYASSPAAYRDTILVPVGGDGRAMAAFKQTDGSLVWKKGDAGNAYSSPVVIDVGGLDQAVIVMRQHVVAFNPVNGDVQWSHKHEAGYGINIATPLWVPDPAGGAGTLVVSSAYDAGTRALRLQREGNRVRTSELWHSSRFYVRQCNLVHVDGVLYGANGGAATYHAADLKTGEILWQERAYPRGTAVFAGGKLILLDEDGNLTLTRPSRKGLEVLAKASVLSSEAWTPPSLVGSRLYLRTGAKMVALELGPEAPKPPAKKKHSRQSR